MPGNNGIYFGGGTAIIYFLEVEESFIKLGSTLKKSDLVFFDNCTELMEKIKKRILKRSEVYDIVDYYNRNCN